MFSEKEQIKQFYRDNFDVAFKEDEKSEEEREAEFQASRTTHLIDDRKDYSENDEWLQINRINMSSFCGLNFQHDFGWSNPKNRAKRLIGQAEKNNIYVDCVACLEKAGNLYKNI